MRLDVVVVVSAEITKWDLAHSRRLCTSVDRFWRLSAQCPLKSPKMDEVHATSHPLPDRAGGLRAIRSSRGEQLRFPDHFLP